MKRLERLLEYERDRGVKKGRETNKVWDRQ